MRKKQASGLIRLVARNQALEKAGGANLHPERMLIARTKTPLSGQALKGARRLFRFGREVRAFDENDRVKFAASIPSALRPKDDSRAERRHDPMSEPPEGSYGSQLRPQGCKGNPPQEQGSAVHRRSAPNYSVLHLGCSDAFHHDGSMREDEQHHPYSTRTAERQPAARRRPPTEWRIVYATATLNHQRSTASTTWRGIPLKSDTSRHPSLRADSSNRHRFSRTINRINLRTGVCNTFSAILY
jgi:hypothetical protein